jgi:heme-degrading monooxygenase HmoA
VQPVSRSAVVRDTEGEDARIVTVFRSRLRPEVDEEYRELAARMEARARAMPGLVDFKTFTAEDGERVSIVVFDSWGHHEAWRTDEEHRVAQGRGRAELYETYAVQVAREIRHRRFPGAFTDS